MYAIQEIVMKKAQTFEPYQVFYEPNILRAEYVSHLATIAKRETLCKFKLDLR